MRGLLARVALVFLALVPITASGDSPAAVLQATPGTDGNAIARFTLRFSEPMAPLGGGDTPITMACAVDGAGRWVDPTTYVWDYAHALPGGISCKATLKPSLKTLAGHDVRGTQSFTIDTGGPTAKAILPDEGDDDIEEGQTFFVATTAPSIALRLHPVPIARWTASASGSRSTCCRRMSPPRCSPRSAPITG